MDKNRPNNADNPPKVSALRNTFHRHAMITISDEQIRRILMPIIKMINEGRFHNRRKTFVWWLQKLLVVALAIASVIFLVALI